MRKNECRGVFSTGKCVITREEGKKLGLRILPKRIICINSTNEFGECNMILLKSNKIEMRLRCAAA